MSEKRNIVLITLDSVRADHCSFLGYQRKTTPTIDKMARKGLYFENAIASGVATAPSLVGVFTGDYTLNDSLSVSPDKAYRWRKEIYSRKTLAEVLSRKGYITAAFHANPWASRIYGFNKGFKYFQDFLSWDTHSKFSRIINKFRRNKYINFILEVKDVIRRNSTLVDWIKIYPYILDWINKVSQPYFLWILLLDTHLPYIPPKKYQKFGRKRSSIYLLYLNWKIRKNMFNSENVSEKEKEEVVNAYDNSILYANECIKRLYKDLKDDDPIFIIHADHGEAFGEHGTFYHSPILYEELIHVPLVIYNADIKEKIEEPVLLTGIAPTILELLNVKNEFPSKSFLNGGDSWVISRVIDNGKWKIAIRMKEWKYIEGQKKGGELYYLKKDPYEQENIANEHTDLAEEMKKIINLHFKHISKKIKNMGKFYERL